jgi:hypothetical protein
MIVARHEYVFSALLNRPGRPVVLRTRSYRTLRDGSFRWRFSRHFVPGYDRTVPPGRGLSASLPGTSCLYGLDIYRRSCREFCAPKGQEDSAQGFNPGN